MLLILRNSHVKSWRNHKIIKLFINKYHWEGMNFTPDKIIGKKLTKNVTIAFIVLYV